MKLCYKGIKPYIILPMVKNPEGGKGIRVNRNDVFECDPEEAAALLKWNKQYVKPLFVEATAPVTKIRKKKDEGEDLLKDIEPGKNNMLGSTDKRK